MGSPRCFRQPPVPSVDRTAARTAEERFFERFAAKVNAADGLYDPLTRRTYDCSPRNRVTKTLEERSREVKALVKRLAERDLMRTYDEMPKNGIILHEILHKELLGRPTVRLVLAGAALSPVEDLIRQGSSTRPAGPEDLSRVTTLVVRNPSVFHYLGAFSTTGWEESARRAVSGPNFLAALLDLREEAWRAWFPPDPRWRSAARIFDLATEEEKVAAVRRWVKRHPLELIMDEMTEELVAEELGYEIPIIRRAFEAIAAEDPYVRLDAGPRPWRLVRTYG